MKALIDQIVKNMYTIKTADKVDTVMTLQYLPFSNMSRDRQHLRHCPRTI